MTKKKKFYVYLSIGFIITAIIFWCIGVKLGIIDVSWLPVFFTVFFIIIVPFITVVVLAIVYIRKYNEKKKVLIAYEKTFGLIYDDIYDLNEEEILIYQNYLEDDN